MLMHQLLSGRSAVSDRYYRALYAVLLSEGARGAAAVPYTHLTLPTVLPGAV